MGCPMRRAVVFGTAMFASLVACAVPVRAIGVVTNEGPRTVITSNEGRSRSLALKGPHVAMRYLDGHEVDLEGLWRGGAINVDRWRVSQGLHGLPAWVGELRRTPNGLVLHVLADDVSIPVDEDSADILDPFVGRMVLIEGFLEVSVGLRVMFYRPLFDEAGVASP
jgi:hypothetical protein